MSNRNRLLHLLHFQLIAMIAMLLFALPVRAQVSSDTIQLETVVEVKKKGSIFKGRPGKSLLFSLVVPGTGQIYNKSYLRVPFVWGAVGGMGYLMVKKSKEYACARDYYKAKIDGTDFVITKDCPKIIKDNPTTLDAGDVRVIRDNANGNRQLMIIGFSLTWLAQGIDAFVDAHLKTFDVNNDLSIDFSPRLDNDPNAPMRVGLFLTLK